MRPEWDFELDYALNWNEESVQSTNKYDIVQIWKVDVELKQEEDDMSKNEEPEVDSTQEVKKALSFCHVVKWLQEW